MTSFVFPGQGSQFPQMAKDFHDNFKIAKSIFQEIEEYTSINLRKIIFENEEQKLNITQYTQICIFAVSYVIYQTYFNEKNIQNNNINVMMGHSLGEYTALACSNKLDLKDCCIVLKKRGELMNNAVEPNKTGMAALIGKDSDYIQKIINENNLKLEIANDNSPTQIVISGSIEEINNNKELFLKNDIKKFVNLNVSAAFHSQYMNVAQEKLGEEINNLNFNENDIKIISNYDAGIYKDSFSIKNNLLKQMANKVNWTKSIRKLDEFGETDIIEIGPSRVLNGLIKRISNKFNIISINKISDLD